MTELALDAYDKEVARFLAQKYRDHEGNMVSVKDFPRFDEVGKDKAFDSRKRLTQYGLIKGMGSWEIEVLPACVELVHEWDNPPLRDYWDEATRRFRSWWWSLLVLGFVVGLPLVVTWIGMIKTVLEWFGILHGSGK